MIPENPCKKVLDTILAQCYFRDMVLAHIETGGFQMHFNGYFADHYDNGDSALTLAAIERAAVLLGESDATEWYRANDPDDTPDDAAFDIAPEYSRRVVYELAKASLQFQGDLTHIEEMYAHGFDAAAVELLHQADKL